MGYVKGVDLEKLVCEVLFQGITANLPGTYYVGLASGALPAADATLATVVATEVVGTGYSRFALARNTTDWNELAGGTALANWNVTSASRLWTAGADWTGNCDFTFLCDVASGSAGRFFGAVELAVTFRMLIGDTYQQRFTYRDQ